ncbi:MAG: hydrogenase subunit MbhD domain-containing protein, partial [Christensenellales bacterium]|nr:hydrogenase subunit MbhD domain-containing protein [Christensenellales bacterium]
METVNVLLLLFILGCAATVSFTKDLLTSIILFMAQSTAMCVIWIFLRSPDLAIT